MFFNDENKNGENHKIEKWFLVVANNNGEENVRICERYFAKRETNKKHKLPNIRTHVVRHRYGMAQKRIELIYSIKN